MKRSQAEEVVWCHVFDGQVHAANWTRYGDGCLTTLTENDDGDIVCDRQTDMPFDRLLLDAQPWRERRTLGPPVCQVCEEDVAEEEMLRELARDG